MAPLRDRLARKWRLTSERALADGLAREHADPALVNELVRALTGNTAGRTDPVRLHKLIAKLRRAAR